MDCPSLPYFLTSRVDWVDSIDTAWHKLWYGIENLIHWFPYIWRDRDWDHRYCSDILRHKLLRWAAHEEKYGHHVGCERDARRMRICADLLRRVEADEYHDGLAKANGLRTPNWWFEDVGLGMSEYKNDATEQEGKQLLRIMKQANRQRQDELEYCFKLMAKHYLGWWN